MHGSTRARRIRETERYWTSLQQHFIRWILRFRVNDVLVPLHIRRSPWRMSTCPAFGRSCGSSVCWCYSWYLAHETASNLSFMSCWLMHLSATDHFIHDICNHACTLKGIGIIYHGKLHGRCSNMQVLVCLCKIR